MSNYADMVKGKGLVLITGKKGSGKSHFAVKIMQDIRDKYPDHPIYSDITGLKIEGVLPSPDDWHDVPNNCTIFYDEIQLKSWADNSNNKISSDPRVKDMTLIRKQNKNIVLITQDPMFIHSALRTLVDYHYHLSHPFKDGKPKVFYFAGAMYPIDAKGVYQSQALETFTHPLDAETSKLYDSIEPDAKHDQKKKIPKRIIYMSAFIVFLVLVAIPAGIWGVKKVAGFIFGAKERSVEQMAAAKGQSVSATAPTLNPAQGLAQAGQNMPQMPDDIARQQQLETQKKYLSAYTIEVGNDDMVRPASIVAIKGRCMAYNRFGDGLNITQAHCMDMLKHPDKIPHPRLVSSIDNSGVSVNSTQVPASTVAPTSAPMMTAIPKGVSIPDRNYAFNADTSHEYVFKN